MKQRTEVERALRSPDGHVPVRFQRCYHYTAMKVFRLLNIPLLPGTIRKLGFYFPYYEEAVPLLLNAKRFYLWEGSFVGEALILDNG